VILDRKTVTSDDSSPDQRDLWNLNQQKPQPISNEKFLRGLVCQRCGAAAIKQNQFLPNGSLICDVCRNKTFQRESTWDVHVFDRSQTSEIVKMVIDGRKSQRTVARELSSRRATGDNRNPLHVHTEDVGRLLLRIARNSLDPLEYYKERKLKPSPYLCIDATFKLVRRPSKNELGHYPTLVISDPERSSMLQVKTVRVLTAPKDHIFKDQMNYGLLVNEYVRILSEIRDKLDYYPSLIIIDPEPALRRAVVIVWPFTVIQICITHVWRRINTVILPTERWKTRLTKEDFELQEYVKNKIRRILFSESKEEFSIRLDELISESKEKWQSLTSRTGGRIRTAIRILKKFRHQLQSYRDYEDAPRSTNEGENLNKQLKGWIKNRPFDSPEHADLILSMFANFHNLTPISSSKAGRVGQSPAQMSGDSSCEDWLVRITKKRTFFKLKRRKESRGRN